MKKKLKFYLSIFSKNWNYILAFFILIFSTVTTAQDNNKKLQGVPLTISYGPAEHKAGVFNSSIKVLPNGETYVANSKGLLKYDGVDWTLIDLPRKSSANILLPDGEKLWVGGYDNLGWAETDEFGFTHYHDVLASFPENLKEKTKRFGAVWDLIKIGDTVYARTTESIFVINEKENFYDVWDIPLESRSIFKTYENKIISRINNVGLVIWENGKYELIPETDIFKTKPLYHVFEKSNYNILVSTNGFYKYEYNKETKKHEVSIISEDAKSVFEEDPPYSSTILSDGTYVFGSYDGDLIWFNSELQFKGKYSTGKSTILDIYPDEENGIWITTKQDIIKMDWPSPWTLYGEKQNLFGTVLGSAFQQDKLWLATSLGVYKSVMIDGMPHFEMAIKTNLEANAVAPFKNEGIIVADRTHVHYYPSPSENPNKKQEILTADIPQQIIPSRFNKNVFFIVSETEFIKIEYLEYDRKWAVKNRWDFDDEFMFQAFFELSEKEWWFGNPRGKGEIWKFYKQNSRDILYIDEKLGVEIDKETGVLLYPMNQQIRLLSGDYVYLYDHFNKKFIKKPYSQVLPKIDNKFELSIKETPLGTFAYTSNELWYMNSEALWTKLYFNNPKISGFSGLFYNQDGTIRMTTWAGLLQYDFSTKAFSPLASKVALRSAYIINNEEKLYLPINSTTKEINFHAAEQKVGLDFKINHVDTYSEIRFKIQGIHDEWSEWSPIKNGGVFIARVKPGTYWMEVEGRTPSGRPIESLKIKIISHPTFFEKTEVKFIGYVVAISLFFFLAIKISQYRTKRVEELNRELAKKINERTTELEEANKKLSQLTLIDGLTNAYNRRYLEETLKKEIETHKKTKKPLSVLMIDVDHFKKFNDSKGHLKGDERLKLTSSILQKFINENNNEFLARYGGEEFTIVLPEKNKAEALKLADYIRETYARETVDGTISVGVYSSTLSLTDDISKILSVADANLYKAKEQGRNRVVS